MTMLALTDNGFEVRVQVSGAMSLRTWLADRWAILFSHPQDFAQEQFEADRWISILSQSFSAHRVAALALLSGGHDAEDGWIGRLAASTRYCVVMPSLELCEPAALMDPAVNDLRAYIDRSGPRFAMIIDSDLRHRRTLSYRLPGELPSPLDLLGWAVALRKKDRAEQRMVRAGSVTPEAGARRGVSTCEASGLWLRDSRNRHRSGPRAWSFPGQDSRRG